MKTISQIKKEWQTHNRDNGLSWNEVSQLVDEVVDCIRGPGQDQVGTKMSVDESNYKIVESYDRAIGRTYCGNCVETLPEKTFDRCPYCGVKFKGTKYKP